MSYISRIVEAEIKAKLNASGAVLIRGPKACGKTETALRLASSVLRVDQDEQVPYLMDADRKRLYCSETQR